MRKLFVILLLPALLCGCNQQSEKQSQVKDIPAAEINPENLVRYDMDVTGMTCTGCEETIESGVSELAGIESVEAHHMDAKTFVVFDSSLTSIEDVRAAIESKGYKVADSKMMLDKPEKTAKEKVTE